MEDDFNGSLSSKSRSVDDKLLMGYLTGKLPAESKRLVEEAMVDSVLLSEAMDGLQTFDDTRRIERLKAEVEHSLQLNLNKKRKRIGRSSLKDMQWPIFFTIILLILLLAAIAVFFSRNGL